MAIEFMVANCSSIEYVGITVVLVIVLALVVAEFVVAAEFEVVAFVVVNAAVKFATNGESDVKHFNHWDFEDL